MSRKFDPNYPSIDDMLRYRNLYYKQTGTFMSYGQFAGQYAFFNGDVRKFVIECQSVLGKCRNIYCAKTGKFLPMNKFSDECKRESSAVRKFVEKDRDVRKILAELRDDNERLENWQKKIKNSEVS